MGYGQDDVCRVQAKSKLKTTYAFSKLCLFSLSANCMGFPGGASGEEPASPCRRHKRQGFDPWVGKILWRRKWQLIPVFLPGESCGQRSLVGYSPWVAKSRTQLSMSMSCVSFYCKSKMNQPHVCLYPLPFLPLRSAQCVKRWGQLVIERTSDSSKISHVVSGRIKS